MRFFLSGIVFLFCLLTGCTSEPQELAYIDDITVSNDFYVVAVDGNEPVRTGKFMYSQYAPFVRMTPGKHNVTLSKKKTSTAGGVTRNSNLTRTIEVVVESGAGYRIADTGYSLMQTSAM